MCFIFALTRCDLNYGNLVLTTMQTWHHTWSLLLPSVRHWTRQLAPYTLQHEISWSNWLVHLINTCYGFSILLLLSLSSSTSCLCRDSQLYTLLVFHTALLFFLFSVSCMVTQFQLFCISSFLTRTHFSHWFYLSAYKTLNMKYWQRHFLEKPSSQICSYVFSRLDWFNMGTSFILDYVWDFSKINRYSRTLIWFFFLVNKIKSNVYKSGERSSTFQGLCKTLAQV